MPLDRSKRTLVTPAFKVYTDSGAHLRIVRVVSESHQQTALAGPGVADQKDLEGRNDLVGWSRGRRGGHFVDWGWSSHKE